MSEGSPPSDHGQATLARGASIGRYVVLGLVGRGGMGEVYAAYDPELDRKVAVKLLRVKPGAGVSLTEGRQRTLREAQAIARLSHPNVVVVYDVGTFEEKVFIAMEFVEGNTAGFWAQSQTRSWQDALKVYLAAGRGLAAAHEKGLVHRDFKPDNIMVSRDGQVRVMDFGLARQAEKPVVVTPGERAVVTGDGVTTTQRLPAPPGEPGLPPRQSGVVLRESGAPIAPLDGSTLVLTPTDGEPGAAEYESAKTAAFDQRLTRTGAMMGTPAYMAPEQFRGRATDARSDQFAFCVALYEALYGERPFGGNTLMALTTNVVNGRVREAPTNTKVPLWIRKILMRGLRVNADERFPSMVELLDALAHDPAVARRRWLLATSGAVLLLAAGTGFGMRQGMAESKPVCRGGPEKLEGIWELVPPGSGETLRQTQIHEAFLKTGKSYAKDVWATTSRALTNYARAWTDMYKETCEATAVNKVQSTEVMDLRMDCLNERLGGLRALTDVFGEATGEVVENAVSASNALASLDRCADVPVLRAVVRPPEDSETRQRVDDLRARLTDLKARFSAGRYADVLKEIPAHVARTRTVGYQPLLAESLAVMGNVLMRSHHTEDAELALAESFLAADASRHDEVRAESAEALVYVVGYQANRFDEAKRWASIAEAVLQRLGGHELLRAWLKNDLGAIYLIADKQETAVHFMEEALALKQKALGADHPDVGVSEGNVAITLAELGQPREALKHIERSLSVMEKGLGAAHPDLAIQLANHGEILNALGRSEEARASFERAKAIWERELGPDDRSLADALTGIGISYLSQRRPVDALIPLERAIKIRQSKETNLAKYAETKFALARALWAAKRDRGRARELAEEARTDYAKVAAKQKLDEVATWLKQPPPG